MYCKRFLGILRASRDFKNVSDGKNLVSIFQNLFSVSGSYSCSVLILSVMKKFIWCWAFFTTSTNLLPIADRSLFRKLHLITRSGKDVLHGVYRFLDCKIQSESTNWHGKGYKRQTFETWYHSRFHYTRLLFAVYLSRCSRVGCLSSQCTEDSKQLMELTARSSSDLAIIFLTTFLPSNPVLC